MPAALQLREIAASAAVPSAFARLRGALESLSPDTDHVDPAALDALLTRQLRSARELGRAHAEAAAITAAARLEPLITAVPAVDELLAGGLPRGRMVEIVGARSSGRFSAVLAALAAVTRAGEAAALVDLGDGLDPQAADALGVDLSRLLWLRPLDLRQALAATEILLGGGFPMVAVDLGSPPVPRGRGSGGEAAWLRLARAAQAQGAALLVASPYRISGIAAAAVLQAARGRALWLGLGASRQRPEGESGRAATAAGPAAMAAAAPRLLGGLSSQVTIEKCRGRLLPAERRRELQLRLPETVPVSTTTILPASLPASAPAAAPLAPAVPAAAAAPVTPAAQRGAAAPLAPVVAPGPVRRAASSLGERRRAAAAAMAAAMTANGERPPAVRPARRRAGGFAGGL
jgi:hypothetical protein